MIGIMRLISETERWHQLHKAMGRHIEAAACAIRLKALRDALEALKETR